MRLWSAAATPVYGITFTMKIITMIRNVTRGTYNHSVGTKFCPFWDPTFHHRVYE